jgi:transcriptional regulator with XRE-family HTH domain
MTTACATAPAVTMEQLRLLAGLDLTRLAELAGCSIATVGRLERGETQRLRAATVEKVALALHQALTLRGRTAPSFDEIFLIILAERDRERKAGAA